MTTTGTLTERTQYCELHSHSCFSLLDGVPFPEQLAEAAHGIGLPALALTDHDAVYGLVPFYFRAKELGVKPILGAELTMEDGSHLTLLCETNEGYANLCYLISDGRMNAPKGSASLKWSDLEQHKRGLICLTGCRKGPVARQIVVNDLDAARTWLAYLVELFGKDNIFVELQRNLRRDDFKISRRLAMLAAEQQIPVVATGNVHYLTPDDADLQDVMVSIRERVPLKRAGALLRPCHDYYLKSAKSISALYPDLPLAVNNTNLIAERCNVEIPSGLQVLPKVPTPRNQTADQYLQRLCLKAFPKHYTANRLKAQAQLRKELDIIQRLGLANYFLLVWDIMHFCKRQRILAHGRGSAANSIVAYLLAITAVDPIRQGLVVERFISVEHGGTPDIDIDIDAKERERVIQYVAERWGRKHVAMACNYITFRAASAIRDAGFALGFKPNVIEEVAKALESERHEDDVETDEQAEQPEQPVNQLAESPSKKLSLPEWQRLAQIASRLQKRPRHLGQHNGGTIVTGVPIAGVIPIEPARMKDRVVVQLDKEHLETLGIVKVDLLGLRALQAITKTRELIQKHHHVFIDLAKLDPTDKKVFDLIRSGQTIGLFQIESGAQMSIQDEMVLDLFEDLLKYLGIRISLIRPGPMQGRMVRPYLDRRNGREPVTYLHPFLENALKETLGVVIFQEQVIMVARDVAGWSEGKGEQLRRALGSKYAAEAVEKFRNDFIADAQKRGVDYTIALQIWDMIAGFAGYSFSKAHAASFAMIVFWSAWLKAHYPTEYFCGLLCASPLGTYPPNVLEAEARRAGVKFLPFDINYSEIETSIQDGAIRYGLNYVKDIGDSRAEAIVTARVDKPFESVVDFIRRTNFSRRSVEWLIKAGTFDSFGERRHILGNLEAAFAEAKQTEPQLFDMPYENNAVKPMTQEERTVATFKATGVTGGMHLAELRKDKFAKAGCISLHDLRKLSIGTKVRVGGVVADGVRRPPTAHGTAFIRLDQPDGLVDVILPKKVYDKHWQVVRSMYLIVEGRLKEKNGAVISVQAFRVKVA